MNELKGIEQGRAEFAYNCAYNGKKIKELVQLSGGKHYYKDDNYKSYVKRIPAMIKVNGLGGALAFVYSKRKSPDLKKGPSGEKSNPKNAYDLIYEQTREWLVHNSKKYTDIAGQKWEDETELVDMIVKLPSEKYRLVTMETLAFFQWLKRFSEGIK